MSDESDWNLVCPFLDASPKYALGVELGMLYEQLQESNHHRGFYMVDNQEQILLLANRLGWSVDIFEPGDEWFFVEMSKR